MSATPDLNSDGRDPADLARDTEEIRADMDRTLDALERKFSPDQLLDRSLGYLREHGADIAETVGNTVRQNPLPVLMTAAGLLWMVTSSYRNLQRGDRYMRYPGIVPEKGLGDKIKRGAATAGSRVRHTGQAAINRARSATHSAADTVSGAVNSTRETVSGAVNSTREQTQRARSGFQAMMDEQPIVVGAIGLAVGAIIGAALPTTEWENRTLGDTRDRALAKAKELGEREYEGLRETIRGEVQDSTESTASQGTAGSRKAGSTQASQFSGQA